MLQLKDINSIDKNTYESFVKERFEIEKTSNPWIIFKGGYNLESLKNILENDETHGKSGFNSYVYFLVDSYEILGSIRIRLNIENSELTERGGHIGYGITPKHRKKGYATKILELGLLEAKKLGLKKVLLTCKVGNIGSIKTITKNGGVFERLTIDSEAHRYWIDIK